MSNPAELYESYIVPAVHSQLVPSLVAAAQPQPGEQVLDVGCGTGVVARAVAARVGPAGTVVGLDPSTAMLRVARRVTAGMGRTVAWVEGPAEEMPFAAGSFDLVVCQQVLQFVTDRPAALREMYRVLRSGGRAVLHVMLGVEHHPFEMQLSQSIARRLGIPATSDIYALGDRGELRALLEQAGFARVDIDVVEFEIEYPDPEHFVARRITAATAAIPSMQSLTDDARAVLTSAVALDMRDAVAARTRRGHLVDRGYSHLIQASRPSPARP
jgi:ubiquinone/menaquinone biosynthesis C-methylase UbiE